MGCTIAVRLNYSEILGVITKRIQSTHFFQETSITHDYVAFSTKRPTEVTHTEFSFNLSLFGPSETLYFRDSLSPSWGIFDQIIIYLLVKPNTIIKVLVKPTDSVSRKLNKFVLPGHSP